MVLIARTGGAGSTCASRPHRPPAGDRRRRKGLTTERGAQALEFVMLLPAVAMVMTLVGCAALLGVDLLTAQSIAREAARAAAVDDDAAARAAVAEASGNRQVDIVLDPPGAHRRAGDAVTARVRLHSQAFTAFGVDVIVPAEAVMRVEQP